MKISRQRLLFGIVNFVLALLYTVPISLFLERVFFPDTKLYTLTAIAALSTLGYITGSIVMKTNVRIAITVCFVTAAVIAGVVLMAMPNINSLAVLYALYVAFMAVYFFFVARKSGYAIYSPFAVSGIAIYLLVMILMRIGYVGEQAETLLNYLSIAFFLLSLYALSASSLRRSLHKGVLVKSVSYPQGMQMRNFLLVTVFIILAAIISNIYPLISLIPIGASGLMKLMGKLFGVISAVLGLFFGLFRGCATADEQVIDSGESIMMGGGGGTSVITELIFIIVVFSCLLFLLILFFKWLISHHRNVFKGFGKLFKRIRSLLEKKEDYVDVVESLSWKGLFGAIRDSFLETAKKITQKPERIDDMPDNRMKVRFAYKELLKKGQERSPAAICETPIEFYENDLRGASHLEEFIYYYNDARYSTGDVPDSAAQSAREALKVKLAKKN